jgi:hypothetical protein
MRTRLFYTSALAVLNTISATVMVAVAASPSVWEPRAGYTIALFWATVAGTTAVCAAIAALTIGDDMGKKADH